MIVQTVTKLGYDNIFALRGWKKEKLGGIEYELNSILVQNGKGRHTVL